MFWQGFHKVCFPMLLKRLYKAFHCFTRLLQGFFKAFTRCLQCVLQDVFKSACSVAATYKPPMLVPRVRLPAGASHLVSPWASARNTVVYKACTMFFTRLLQCLFTRLLQCFLQGFYKMVAMLYNAFTRF